MEGEEPKTVAEDRPRKRIIMRKRSLVVKTDAAKTRKDDAQTAISSAEPPAEEAVPELDFSPERHDLASDTQEAVRIPRKRGRKPKQRTENSEECKASNEAESAVQPLLSEQPDLTGQGVKEGSASDVSVQSEGSKDETEDSSRIDSKEATVVETQSEDTSDQSIRQDKKPYDGRHNRQDRIPKGQKAQNPNRKLLTMEEVSIPESEYNEHVKNRIIVGDLSALNLMQLKEKLCQMTGKTEDDYIELKKQEVIAEILRCHSSNGGVLYSIGTLEVLSEGYGFLRSPLNSYLSGPEDVYISPAQIKFLNLKTGDTIEGQIRTPKENERFFAISRIAFINGDAPVKAKIRAPFDSLVPLYPNKRINLETERTDNDVSMRIINLFAPIGKGQRALITAPPRTGKTILLQQIANAITENHPEIKLIVLLVDERPEEVTDMRRNVKGEVIASTFDEQASRHVQVAEMVIEKAKRLVEHRHDVVILLDSITRLARAYNQTVPASGKILSGGVDSNALHKPKRFFGAARNIEGGGSLTIIASALIETGSRMDEVIFEEFKGTGNSEIVLDRRMADMRLFPAMNLKKSGTRRDDLLLTETEAARVWALRNAFSALDDEEMTGSLVDKMRKTKNNETFLRSMNTGVFPVS